MTRFWKTLKTVENLAEKRHLTIGSCLKLAKLFVGGVMKWREICKNLQKNILLRNWVQFCARLPRGKKKKRKKEKKV
jgi:hypothetical protein